MENDLNGMLDLPNFMTSWLDTLNLYSDDYNIVQYCDANKRALCCIVEQNVRHFPLHILSIQFPPDNALVSFLQKHLKTSCAGGCHNMPRPLQVDL